MNENLKRTDYDRVWEIIIHARNPQIEKLGKWVDDLTLEGFDRKASRVLRVAERMQTSSFAYIKED